MTEAIGIAWYTPETWKQLAAIPKACIEIDYQHFIRKAEKLEQQFVARGMRTERITIDVERMTAWCHRNGYEIDSKGRSVFVVVQAMARDDPEALNAPVDDRTRVVQ
jgi:hypothetical protein